MKHPHPLPTSRHFPDPQHFADLERLGHEITELAAHIHAATFQLLELIRIFDEEQGWAGEGVNSSATAPALLYLLHPCSRVPTGSAGNAV